MSVVLNVTKKQLDAQLGEPPVFDPKQPADVQIELWKAWSARKRLVLLFEADQQKRNQGGDPDEGR